MCLVAGLTFDLFLSGPRPLRSQQHLFPTQPTVRNVGIRVLDPTKRRNDQRRGGDVVFSLFDIVRFTIQQSHCMSGARVICFSTCALVRLSQSLHSVFCSTLPTVCLFVCLNQAARVCGPSRWETRHVPETSCMLSVRRQSLSKARRRSYSAHAKGVACN